MNSVAMVATNTACEAPEVLAGRLRGLVDAGWDARLLCKGKRWRELPELHGPELAGRVDFIAKGRSGPSEDRALERRLAKMRPDLIHFHSGAAADKGLALRARLGSRIAVSFRSDGADLKPREMLWREADLFLFTDPALLERAAANGCPRESSAILFPPVTGPPANPQVDGPLRLLSAGPLVWERGLEHSIHAVRLALDRGVDCRYRILGNGDHLVAVGFARHQLGLEDRVEIAIEDCGGSLAAGLREADVFIDPAVADATSASPLLGAQALGVPYVATQRDGLAADAGVVVPRRDGGAIAEALVRLAGDPGLRGRMAAAGREHGDPTAAESDLSRLQQLYSAALRTS